MHALEAAKKAKAKNAKKKGVQEDHVAEEAAGYEEVDERREEAYDLENKAQFEKALHSRIKMPFIFGPIEFKGLNVREEEEAFDFEVERENVITVLQRTSLLPQ